jgi:hypothetical protein
MWNRVVVTLSLLSACTEGQPCYLDLSLNDPPNDRILVDLQDVAYLEDQDGSCVVGLTSGQALVVDQTCDVVANTPCSEPSPEDLPGG